MRVPSVTSAVGFAAALLLSGACGPEDDTHASGVAAGTFDCEIYQPGSNPANFGNGVVELTFGGDARTLAQGAAAFAIDAEGSQTLDPAEAAYFAVQVYQSVSETKIELFEARLLPASWVPGEVVIDGSDAIAFLGEVLYDANGTVIKASIIAEARGGTIRLDASGDQPREVVSGALTDLTLVEP